MLCAVPGSAAAAVHISSVSPLRGHHTGAVRVTVSGSGFASAAASAAEVTCCWDHHPGALPSQTIASVSAFPDRSSSAIVGGDGTVDVETPALELSDGSIVCESYASVPGYTHSDDLLLGFGLADGCVGGSTTGLIDTLADFQFWLDTSAFQLYGATPRGGPAAGNTTVTLHGAHFGGADPRCRFGTAAPMIATVVSLTAMVCVSPPLPGVLDASSYAGASRALELRATTDGGGSWSYGFLSWTYYATAPPAVFSVWPLGGPSAGGTALTVRGVGFHDYHNGGGLAVLLGGVPLATLLVNETMLLAFTPAVSNASDTSDASDASDASGWYSYGGHGNESGGDEIRVSLNGEFGESRTLGGGSGSGEGAGLERWAW